MKLQEYPTEEAVRQALEEQWSQLEHGAQYLFNKSHSLAYAHVTYYNAYAKAHYPQAWAAAYLEVYKDLSIVNLCPSLFLPPCIHGIDKCHVAGDKVHLPMSVIPNLGPKVIEALVEYGPYVSVQDMLAKVPPKKVNVRHRAAISEALLGTNSFASILGVVFADDPITAKRKYYTNKGYGNTLQPASKVPGYLTDAEKFVAKGSGKTWVRGTIIDEMGKLEFMAGEELFEALTPFIKTSTVVTISGQYTRGTYWLRSINV